MQLTPVLRQQVANTIRMLAADAIQKANSGHPGAPMGQADLALVLWHEFLRFDPTDPGWAARDRFVLSCGHASMLLYSLLHMWGFDVSMDDIRAFRQWDSITPGHPEVGLTPGVEVTTGPLGQGVANSVGMALAAKLLSARIDVPGDPFQVMGQRTYALCSDGDLMEGLSSEAASLAGHWRLDNLVWLYDDNKITIDGTTELSFTEDVRPRFEGAGWVVFDADGHDAAAVRAALTEAKGAGRPVLIICRTHIGYGSPGKVDTSASHGAPLGHDEIVKTRVKLGYDARSFEIADDVRAFLETASAEKRAARATWDEGFAAWRVRNPENAKTYDQLWANEAPADLWEKLVGAVQGTKATRKLSAAAIAEALAHIPGLVGGSADLTGSNGVGMKEVGLVGHPDASEQYDFSFGGRQINFGIREHAMGAITNGMLLHGGLRPFTGTFLVFSDYMRPSVRLAALSHLPNIFVFSHDSVFLGEDGPTHQAVEHHWALRIIPGLNYFRPADGLETAMSWAWALQQSKSPMALAVTRQTVPEIARRDGFDPREVWRGGYAVNSCADPEVVLVGTGSELHLCVEAAATLNAEGRRVRVVSMPCYDLFRAQDAAWQTAVIPQSARVATVEAGTSEPWAAITGLDGLNIGVDRFGASEPAEVLAEKFGLTAAQVTERVRAWLNG